MVQSVVPKIASLESDKVVRFQTRWINKSYKGKGHRYRICSVNFPVMLHDRVEAKSNSKKDFEVNWNEQETDELEIVTVTFTRKKHANRTSTSQSEKS